MSPLTQKVNAGPLSLASENSTEVEIMSNAIPAQYICTTDLIAEEELEEWEAYLATVG
jgi:hypothetical protein